MGRGRGRAAGGVGRGHGLPAAWGMHAEDTHSAIRQINGKPQEPNYDYHKWGNTKRPKTEAEGGGKHNLKDGITFTIKQKETNEPLYTACLQFFNVTKAAVNQKEKRQYFMKQRYLEKLSIEELNVTDLVHFEEQFNDALIQTRSRKTQLMMDSIVTLNEEERKMRAENEFLKHQIMTMQKDINRNELPRSHSECPKKAELYFLW
ncbi:hypothetical protein RJ639_033009 [Escallonia herrerae]|uniref:K-box domain-containing protein n=1 Tax=Escallonia herrerae TaxID=1293975 RepID=A0AA88WXX7_9ASTE|nr:hypothetical protein RJ639_033009 [Escallonia herrerae]